MKMINNFIFGIRTEIIFGNGVIKDVGKIAKESGFNRIMLVSDKGVRKTGLTDIVANSLKQADISIIDYDQIMANPRITDCEYGAKIGKEEQIDAIVAMGGGSSIDTGKAIAGMLGNNTLEFEDIQFPKVYQKDPIPLIAVPTTAGTGSEVTTCAIVTDMNTLTKECCYDNKCAPDIALVDPQVLMKLPNDIASSTGLDALTHAIEGFIAKSSTPITEALGLYAISMLQNNLRKYIYCRDIKVCEAMMAGSMLAGLSFGYSNTCAVHSISESLGGEYDTPHGIANAVFLANVSEFNIPAALDKYAKIARAMGVNDMGLSARELAQAGIEEIRMLVKDLRIPKLKEIENINPKDFEKIAKKSKDHLCTADNPIQLTEKEFMHILNKTYAL